MSRYAAAAALFAGLILSGRMAFAQQPEPLSLPLPIHQTFAKDVGGWTSFGSNAKVSTVTDTIKLNAAGGALQYDYAVGKGEMNALMLPILPGTLAHAKSFKFAIRSDTGGAIMFALQEHEGGRYVAAIFAPKDKWQLVELTPADFALSEGKDDPKDPDGKLDLDQVENAGFVDLAVIFAQADSASLNDLFGVKLGAHALYLADFNISDSALPGASAMQRSDPRLDLFAHPQVDWVVIGGGSVVHAPDGASPLRVPGLMATYRQAPGKVFGMLRFVGHARLTGAQKIAFSVASQRPTTLIVQVEERGGGKYNTTVSVPAGVTAGSATPVSVSFADFKPADDSKDDNDHLDLDQVVQIVIIDITGFLGVEDNKPVTPSDNTLYIGDVRAVFAAR